ncbi:ABC transporter permease [Aldersonia sp. NBC_00410]|uniref:ABC transporter permease n=1 Tax=Aldersonia sp. NBC_00410 TaxID=2975954 RepID=UPI00224C9232|nr:ABC transporter permease [Aldersonia sp. NBC_00410]MCX5043759.1 ABC transporter permease [Aldersonia sp. NBC_00410]
MTITLARPAQAPVTAGDFTGTLGMLRLFLRRDRIVLPLWVLLLSLPLASVYVDSIASLYPDESDRAGFAASILSSPAQLALYGPLYNTSLGATGIWKAGMFHTLIGVAVILTVIRHTRAEEETGRAELIDSTAVGRYASLTAALLLGFGASMATGLIGALGLFTTDVPKSGSLAFGLALAGSGLVYTAVAAVAAQLSANARTSRGIAFAVLGAAYALRAIGDAGGSAALTWLAPQGWSLQVRPYAGDRWPVLLLHIVGTVALTALAYGLLRRRDLGAGLITERPGSASAPRWLRGSFGLAWRLQRGSLLAWTIGLAGYAVVIGSVVHGIADELGGGDAIRDIVTRMGGTASLEDAFIRLAFTMLGIGAGAYAISAALRLHAEADAGHAEPILSAAVGRIRWAASHLVFALLGPVLLMTVAACACGLTYGIAAGDIAGKLTDAFGAAMLQLPSIWLLAGTALALFGALPRFAPAAWGVLSAFIALYLLGSISGIPHWVLDLVPFAHTPVIPGGTFDAAAMLWLLVIDAALITFGLFAFRRRDL